MLDKRLALNSEVMKVKVMDYLLMESKRAMKKEQLLVVAMVHHLVVE